MAPSGSARPDRRPGGTVRALAAATPEDRDRVVDLVRIGAVAVVVVWHTTLSLLYWRDGRLEMPNPIDSVPGGWIATWLLQVMPVFFAVGGYVHLTAWRSATSTRAFLRRRVVRLGRPLLPFLAVWVVVEVTLALTGRPPLVITAPGVLAPLWFLFVYFGVALLVPGTARLHERWGAGAILAGGLLLVALDALRLAGVPLVWLLSTALAWVLCHQVGYVWRDRHREATVSEHRRPQAPSGRGAERARSRAIGHREATASEHRRPQPLSGRGAERARSRAIRQSPRFGLGVAGAAAVGLVLLTGPGPYAPSMVSTATQESNLLPATPPVLLVCLLQVGLVLAIGPWLDRLLRRPRWWRPVVAANTVTMSVYLWHMTAAVIVALAYVAWVGPLPTEPSAAWWWTRPLWLGAVLVVLAGIVALVRRFEVPASGASRSTGMRSPSRSVSENH